MPAKRTTFPGLVLLKLPLLILLLLVTPTSTSTRVPLKLTRRANGRGHHLGKVSHGRRHDCGEGVAMILNSLEGRRTEDCLWTNFAVSAGIFTVRGSVEAAR